MLSEASRLLLKLKSTDEYCYILFCAFNKFAEEPSCMRSAKSCNQELDALQSYYNALDKDENFKSRFIYDRMLLSDSDMIFKFKFQKEYYTSLNKTKLYLIKNANHNVFSMHITDFDKVIECNSELYTYRLN